MGFFRNDLPFRWWKISGFFDSLLDSSLFSKFRARKKRPPSEDADTAARGPPYLTAGSLQAHKGPRHDKSVIKQHIGHHLSYQTGPVYTGRKHLSSRFVRRVKTRRIFQNVVAREAKI